VIDRIRPRTTGKLVLTLRLGLALVGLAGLAGCGPTHEKVVARMEKNYQAANYRAAVVDLKNLVRDEPNQVSWRLKLAQSLLRTRDFEEAVGQFSRARELGAPRSAYVPGLAEALIATGRFSPALDALSSAGPETAGDPKLIQLRGVALQALHRYPEAREAWTQALVKTPQDPAAHVGLSNALMALGDPAAAKVELDEANKVAPADFGVHMSLGRWYGAAHQLEPARDEFTRALQLADTLADPRVGKAPALASLGEVDCLVGDFTSAQQRLHELERIAPSQEATLLLKARIAIRQNHTQEARTALEQLLSRNPDSQRGKLLMGIVTFADGKLEQAAVYLSAAVQQAPDDLEARKLLAQVQLRQNRPDEALKTVREPTIAVDADLLSLAGRASLLEGDLPGAVTYFEREQQTAPQDKARSLEVATAYLVANRTADALRLLKELQVPDSLANRREMLLLAVLMRSGQKDDLRAEAQSYARAHSRDGDALMVSARGLLAVHDVAGARALLKQATAIDTRAPQPWLALGLLEWSQNDRAAADAAFSHALEIDAHNPGALLAKAQVALAAGDLDGATGYLEKARATAPGVLSPRVGLARLYLFRSNLDQAASVIAEGHRIAPEDPNVRLLEGLLALATGKAAEAVTTLESLTHQFPQSAALQASLANAYLHAGRAADARTASDAALRLDPNNWPARVLQIDVALVQNDQHGAEQMLAALDASKAPRGLGLAAEGDVDSYKGAFDEALRAYTDANSVAPSAELALKLTATRRKLHDHAPEEPLRAWLRHSPHDVRVLLVLAQNLQQDGNLTEAVQEYEAVLAQSPTQLVALNNLSWLKLQAGDSQGGLALAQRAYAVNGNLPAIADTYGWALVQTGDFQQAVPTLRDANRALPGDNEIQYHLGVALLKSGAADEARAVLQKVVAAPQHGPETEQARLLLSGLRKKTGG
jgi:putative PEP-CTERM system TPR-repeat lipoprotein